MTWTARTMPLWQALVEAHMNAPNGQEFTAEIEALRDWLLPEEPEPDYGHRYEQRHIIWQHSNKLRALLTAQANIARGETND